MEYAVFSELFCSAMEKNGQKSLDEDAVLRFYRFTEHLMEVNLVTNLTAIRDIPGVITKHYVDSLLLSSYIPQNARVLDLGCGPGFPLLPLAIARPDLSLVGLDSTAKKIAFAKETAALVGLKNVDAVAGRAEDAAVRKKLGTFDVVTSRAVANLNILCELCLPYLSLNGRMLAMKGAKIEEETALLKKGSALRVMGGGDAAVHTWELISDEGSETRGVVEIVKKRPCDPKYPRPYAAILKKPL